MRATSQQERSTLGYAVSRILAVAVEGDASKLPVPNVDRVRRCLSLPGKAKLPEDADLPGYQYHGLQGKPKRYAISASGNYRITFGWDGEDAIDVDIEDYH